MTHEQLRGTGTGPSCGSSRLLRLYRAAAQCCTSSGRKAGAGLLRPSTAQWNGERKTRSGDVSGSRPPADPLVRGHCRQRHVGPEPLGATKAHNWKRMVVLGAQRVGKTSILCRFLRDEFVDQYEPTSEDFVRKLFRIRGNTYRIDILDASRERDFPAKRRLSILTGDIFLLVFSVDDRSSFEEVRALQTEILDAKSKVCSAGQLPLVVCANKVDLPVGDWQVSRSEVIQALGDDCAYFETSAKDSTNLEVVFETLAKRGGLPTETGPSMHRKVSLRSYQALLSPGNRAPAGGREQAYGTVCPLARRPSFSSDLLLVTRSRRRRVMDRCQIQ